MDVQPEKFLHWDTTLSDCFSHLEVGHRMWEMRTSTMEFQIPSR
jgi:hypothetical protein